MGKSSIKLASHVLQLLFLGHTGFRFPFAHFPTSQASPPELYRIFWDAVKMLGLYGFHVTYFSVDGAQTNRNLMKMLLPGDQFSASNSTKSMLIPNIFDLNLPKISFIMDYSHVMKKIRNNILKSGYSAFHKRLLTIGGEHIIWDHWLKAFQWDSASNSLKVYQQLTQDHFFLNSQLKMRNKLAEEVLNDNMHHLMQQYRKSLGEQGKELQKSLELLSYTSTLVKVFRDQRPISSLDDARLLSIKHVLNWFESWEKEVKEKEKSLMSFQTREDITSLIVGFNDLCCETFKRHSGSSIIPARINSDPVENIFSQQRGIYNGPNTNPDYLSYSRTMNTIILGEKTMSRKSNVSIADGAMYHQRIDKDLTLKKYSTH